MAIQLPHAMWAAMAFRDMHDHGDEVSWLQPIIAGYFCHGYGGTAVRDLSMGMAPAAMGHVDVPKYWLMGYALTYHSPGDYIYNKIGTTGHPLRLVCRFVEAVDVAITLPGAFEKGVKNFPNAMASGPVAAMASVYGGSVWRYLYNKGRGQDPKMEWMKPGGPTRRGIVYTLFYMWGRKYWGVPESRMFLTLFHTGWEMLQELADMLGWSDELKAKIKDPFLDLFNTVGMVFKLIAGMLKLNMDRTKHKHSGEVKSLR